MRECGGCTLCCKLLPVHGDLRRAGVDLPGNFYKPAGERCPHQRHKKGCAVYGKPSMPRSCRLWNCRWLVDPETADLSRPDRSRYVIDITPDIVTSLDNETGERQEMPAMQVWVDPATPDAWRDPALLAYLNQQGERGCAAIIRYNGEDGFVLLPPSLSMNPTGEWVEIRNAKPEPERSPMEQWKALRRIGAQ